METEQFVRSLAATLRPVRRLRPARWRAVLWAVPAVLCVSIGTVLLGPRSDLLSRAANPQFWLQNALLLIVFAASSAIAFRTSVPGSEVAGHVRALPQPVAVDEFRPARILDGGIRTPHVIAGALERLERLLHPAPLGRPVGHRLAEEIGALEQVFADRRVVGELHLIDGDAVRLEIERLLDAGLPVGFRLPEHAGDDVVLERGGATNSGAAQWDTSHIGARHENRSTVCHR